MAMVCLVTHRFLLSMSRQTITHIIVAIAIVIIVLAALYWAIHQARTTTTMDIRMGQVAVKLIVVVEVVGVFMWEVVAIYALCQVVVMVA